MQEGRWRSVYGVIIAGCVLMLVAFLPLLSRMVASIVSGALCEQLVAAKLSLPQAISLGMSKSELQFVDLRSAEEGLGGARSKPTSKGKYTAYSNPYADETADSGTILPTLAPLVRHCTDCWSERDCGPLTHDVRCCILQHAPFCMSYSCAQRSPAESTIQHDPSCTASQLLAVI